jgi:hypothetical protein
MAERSPQNFRANKSPLQQSPDDLQQGLQHVDVSSSHTELLVGMGDGTANHKRGVQRVGIIPQ